MQRGGHGASDWTKTAWDGACFGSRPEKHRFYSSVANKQTDESE
jgi:hypothetical protein